VLEEGFIAGDSVIHRLDPRIRSIVAGIFSIVVAVSDRFLALIPALLIALFFAFLARLPIQRVFYRLLIVNSFVFFLWLLLPFTTEGPPLFSIGPLIATKAGILSATLITLKSNTIILALMALMATMSVFTMGRALADLCVPSKIVHLIFLTYRYIHVINMEYRRLIQAVKIRGFHPGNNLHTYRTYAYLVGMLLVKSYERAERVRAAMLCRGFRGKFYDLREFELRTTDIIVMFLMLIGISGIALLQWFIQ
jgi:cobalt/nickel transport system permease protein